MDGLYWLRCVLVSGVYEIALLISRVHPNTLSAIQIEDRINEMPGTGLGFPGQTLALQKPPVISESVQLQVQRTDSSWEDWRETSDFETAGPDDPVFQLDKESGEITFGNGINGRIPPAGQAIRAACYQTTAGEAGNLSAGQRWFIPTAGFEGITGVNLRVASGGSAAETLEQAEKRAREELRARYRAITAGDYEAVTLNTPGLRVARAKALPHYHPDFPCLQIPGAVTLVVIPRSRENQPVAPAGDGFLQTIENHLEQHRLVTTSLFVRAAEYVQISVSAELHLKLKADPSVVRQAAEQALTRFLHPITGGPENTGWPFGRTVYQSEIYQLLDGVAGVDFVENVLLQAQGPHRRTAEGVRINPVAVVFSGKHQLKVVESF